MVRSEVEPEAGESGLGEALEYVIDDRVEPVAAVERVRVADHDTTDCVTHGAGDIAGQSVAV